MLDRPAQQRRREQVFQPMVAQPPFSRAMTVVAAEIIAGRPPTKAMVTAMTTLA